MKILKKISLTIITCLACGLFSFSYGDAHTTTIEVNGGGSATVTHNKDGSTTITSNCVGTVGICAEVVVETFGTQIAKGDKTTITTHDSGNDTSNTYQGSWLSMDQKSNNDGSISYYFTLTNFVETE